MRKNHLNLFQPNLLESRTMLAASEIGTESLPESAPEATEASSGTNDQTEIPAGEGNILGGVNEVGGFIDPVQADFTRDGGTSPITQLSITSLGQTEGGLERVRISQENLSGEDGLFLTPAFVAIHDGNFDIYDEGEPASAQLEQVAEDGAFDLFQESFFPPEDSSGTDDVPLVDPSTISDEVEDANLATEAEEEAFDDADTTIAPPAVIQDTAVETTTVDNGMETELATPDTAIDDSTVNMSVVDDTMVDMEIVDEIDVSLDQTEDMGTDVETVDTLAMSEPEMVAVEPIYNGVTGVITGPEGLAEGPIDPGETGFIELEVDPSQFRYLSFVQMIIPSNDAFIASPGDPRAIEIFDEDFNFVGGTFTVMGSDVLDAGTEVNTEEDAAFLNQTAPNTGIDENGVVQRHPGFIGSEGLS